MYGFSRLWDNGKGSLSGFYSSLQSMIANMSQARSFFEEPFMPKAGVPITDIPNPTTRFKPLDTKQVERVIEALKGQS